MTPGGEWEVEINSLSLLRKIPTHYFKTADKRSWWRRKEELGGVISLWSNCRAIIILIPRSHATAHTLCSIICFLIWANMYYLLPRLISWPFSMNVKKRHGNSHPKLTYTDQTGRRRSRIYIRMISLTIPREFSETFETSERGGWRSVVCELKSYWFP